VISKIKEWGHNPVTSEELCKHKQSLENPLDDEKIQAKCSDAIVVVYGSRGAQTEVDTILQPNPDLVKKTVMVIKEETLNDVLKSVSSSNWRDKIIPQAKKVIRYSELPLDDDTFNNIYVTLQTLREELAIKILEGSDI